MMKQVDTHTMQRVEKQCTQCKVGKLEADKVQFCVDRGDKIMLIAEVPAMVCSMCLHKEFDEAIADRLTLQTHALFSKSSGRIFAYQYTDFIRDNDVRTPFKMFDRVRIKAGVNTLDLYDEHLQPGMDGLVVEAGEKPFDYVVEFTLGSRRLKSDCVRVEVDEQDLELVTVLAKKPVKRKSALAKV